MGKIPSTIGTASSRRLPQIAAIVMAKARTSSSLEKPSSIGSTPCPQSTQTRVELTKISVIPGRRSKGARTSPSPLRRASSSSNADPTSPMPFPGSLRRIIASSSASPAVLAIRSASATLILAPPCVPTVVRALSFPFSPDEAASPLHKPDGHWCARYA